MSQNDYHLINIIKSYCSKLTADRRPANMEKGQEDGPSEPETGSAGTDGDTQIMELITQRVRDRAATAGNASLQANRQALSRIAMSVRQAAEEEEETPTD